MTIAELVSAIEDKQSFLCVGLDTDIEKLPPHLPKTIDGVLIFNKAIIDATKEYCVSYKINTAFYEAMGWQGWKLLEDTLNYIPSNCYTIADAKRGDIGNTATQYANAFFKAMHFDSVTVAPYMGEDSVKPFLQYPDKAAIVLGLTSNAGSADFQQQLLADNKKTVYETVLAKVASWGNENNTLFVIGATKASLLTNIRSIIPNHFLLVPGVGAQGGSLEDVYRFGANKRIGLLVNVSRDIIYAGTGEDFAFKAKEKAAFYQKAMATLMQHDV